MYRYKILKLRGYQLGLVFLGLSGLSPQKAQTARCFAEHSDSMLQPSFHSRPGWLERAPEYEFILQARATRERYEGAPFLLARPGRWRNACGRGFQLHP